MIRTSFCREMAKKMRHIKIGDVNDIRGENIRDFVQAAVKLNQTKGDPTKGQ